MIFEIILRYLHFISIFAIIGALVSEHLLLKNNMTRTELGHMARIDAVYGLAAVLLLGVGLTLWFGSIGKPAAFYSRNWLFHTKISLFAAVGLLSVYPTIFFIKNRKGKPDEMVEIPKVIFWMLRFEILLIFIIPFLAGLMAKGIGLIPE
jgi:putative membrane protein